MKTKYNRCLLSILLPIAMIGCSGDDGDGGIEGGGQKPIVHNITGTAATGKPIANSVVRIKGKNGNKNIGQTDATGKFTINVEDLPGSVIIRSERTGLPSLYSVASNDDATLKIANIHPYTDIILRNWFAVRNLDIDAEFDSDAAISLLPSVAEIADIKDTINGMMSVVLANYELTGSFDLIESGFDADGTGFDSFLDNSEATIINNIINISVVDLVTNISTTIVTIDINQDLVILDIERPSIPDNVRALAASDTEIVLVWNASSDNIGVAGYQVYRDGSLLTTTPYPVFSDTGLTQDSQYCYYINAIDGAGNNSIDNAAALSNAANSATCGSPNAIPDTTPPASPQYLQIVALLGTSTNISWTPPIDSDVYRYDVYRSVNSSELFRIASVVASSYVDNNISTEMKYCYQIVALDAALNSSTNSAELCIGSIINQAPVADAGSNQQVAVNDLVQLDGSESTDDTSVDIFYLWEITGEPTGSMVTLSSSTVVNPTFIAAVAGTYVISLRVNDGSLDSVQLAEVTINVGNTQPIANAGSSRSVIVGDVVNLDAGQSSDANMDDLSYLWSLDTFPDGSSASLFDDTSPTPNFTADLLGTYSVSLVVNDGTIDSNPVSITFIATAQPAGEPNDIVEQAQTITQLGYTVPVNALIDQAGDIDWYRFQAQANTTYTFEVYDVSLSLVTTAGVATAGCNPNFRSVGLAIEIFDNFGQTRLANTCNPIGSGNVHNLLTFTPGISGEYTLRISPNNIYSASTGAYKLRILPDYIAQPEWDTQQEPNNVASNAKDIGIGVSAALNSNIITKKSNVYATGRSDIDWFRFVAQANTVYTIELRDVTASLATTAARGEGGCNPGNNYIGLSLEIYDRSGANRLKASCSPVGSENAHNMLTFSTAIPGTYFIRVSLNGINLSLTGSYKLRILPDYSDTVVAEWDNNHEPNNVVSNAYILTSGVDSVITSNITPRNTVNYSTNVSDLDWFRFEAIGGVKYTIDLLDVTSSLATAVGVGSDGCNPYTYYVGLALEIFDTTGTNRLLASCNPQGSGNSHNLLGFAPAISATYFLRISLNNVDSNLSGTYKLRILPDFTAAGAIWDAQHEPNSAVTNSHVISVGLSNSISSTILPRNTASYSTNLSDVDWFYFAVEANVTYNIELFDVVSSLATVASRGAKSCNPSANYVGLAIEVFDITGSNRLVFRCNPMGSAKVHNRLSFSSAVAGNYIIRISLNHINSVQSGSYKLRILPDFAQANAEWDVLAEPNNVASNAFGLTIGQDILTDISARSSASYSTNISDIDWYRFDATATTAYTIELYDIAASLTNVSGRGNPACNTITNLLGLSIEVFDPSGETRLFSQCQTLDVVTGASSLNFTINTAGTYFVRITQNAIYANVAGTYGIRLLQP